MRAVVSWSSGKDSALALHRIVKQGKFEVVGLLTTMTDTFDRVSMHGVRESLLDAQAKELGYPLHKIRIPSPCTNEIYEKKMYETLESLKTQKVSHIIFGDLFLQDIRNYREEKLKGTGFTPVFPVWDSNTQALSKEVLDLGIQAVLTCVDPKQLDKNFVGRSYDETLLHDLPPGIDPCGENGEFHTFVWNAPLFAKPIQILASEKVVRDGFAFADFLPAAQ